MAIPPGKATTSAKDGERAPHPAPPPHPTLGPLAGHGGYRPPPPPLPPPPRALEVLEDAGMSEGGEEYTSNTEFSEVMHDILLFIRKFERASR